MTDPADSTQTAPLPVRAPFMVLALGVEAATTRFNPLNGTESRPAAGRAYAMFCRPSAEIASTPRELSYTISAALDSHDRFVRHSPFHSIGWLPTPYGLAEVLTGQCVMVGPELMNEDQSLRSDEEWNRLAFEILAEWERDFPAKEVAAMIERGVFGDFWLSAETERWIPGGPLADLNHEIGAFCALLDNRGLRAETRLAGALSHSPQSERKTTETPSAGSIKPADAALATTAPRKPKAL